MNSTANEVIFEELLGKNGNVGLITLNRQKALNALNHRMFIALDTQLEEWQNKKDIKAVVIQAAEGRAFCAGGDIRHAYDLKKANDSTIVSFFRDEYRMNSRIHHYPKPYIALLNGITMGGGAGLSIHGSHRVGTEKLILSMPETAIGFYPDIGATYFLSRLPYKIGMYLGLTGARINDKDCFALGLTQFIVAEESLSKILTTLVETSLPNNDAVTTVLKQFSTSVPPSDLMKYKDEIEACFSRNTVEDIVHALENHSSDWCKQTADIIKTKSPTSLKVTLRALQEASKLNFDTCMKIELNITRHFVDGYDFFEGVRAVLIDKDQKPRWQPSKLSEVSEHDVDEYFMPLKTETMDR